MDTTAELDARQVAELSARIVREVERAVVGKAEVLRQVLAAVLCPGGHVLLEDYPGLAKTLLASSLATALGLGFKRIQFTPDLLPGDVTGGWAYNPAAGRFALRRGPVFTQLLLADEINRASPRTQSALLEAMQEQHVTLEGDTLPLPQPFIVIATQNPIESEGTFPLPEAQLDRFAVRLALGYPTPEEEDEILRRRAERREEAVALAQVVDAPRSWPCAPPSSGRTWTRRCGATWSSWPPVPAATGRWWWGPAGAARWRCSSSRAPGPPRTGAPSCGRTT
ncbi:MAG: AAA family ATPase [Anaeromyxobacter sp.]